MTTKIEGIQVGDRVAWLHTYLYGTQKVRQGKVVTISGASAYVRTRRSGKPVLVSLDKLTKVMLSTGAAPVDRVSMVQPQEDEVQP